VLPGDPDDDMSARKASGSEHGPRDVIHDVTMKAGRLSCSQPLGCSHIVSSRGDDQAKKAERRPLYSGRVRLLVAGSTRTESLGRFRRSCQSIGDEQPSAAVRNMSLEFFGCDILTRVADHRVILIRVKRNGVAGTIPSI